MLGWATNEIIAKIAHKSRNYEKSDNAINVAFA